MDMDMDMDIDSSNNDGGQSSASETNSASEESRTITQGEDNNNGDDDNIMSGVSSASSEESDSITQLADQWLLQTPITSKKQREEIEKLLKTPPISVPLKLKTDDESLLEELNRRLYLQPTPNPQRGQLDASVITISSWQKVAPDSEDLIAVFHYDKKKLAWEILARGLELKLKIEIHWDHIVGMRVSLEKYHPGILEVEISQPPLFFESRDPYPTKPADWTSITDFTNGQATLSRKHHLQFPPGVLDFFFEKLLNCEPRFLHMFQLQSNPTMPRTFPVPMRVPGRRKRLRQITMELPSTLDMDLSTAVTVTSQNNDNPTVTSPANDNGSGAADNPLPQFPNQFSTDSDQEATNVEAFPAGESRTAAHGSINRSAPLTNEQNVEAFPAGESRTAAHGSINRSGPLTSEEEATNVEAFPAGESRTAAHGSINLSAPLTSEEEATNVEAFPAGESRTAAHGSINHLLH